MTKYMQGLFIGTCLLIQGVASADWNPTSCAQESVYQSDCGKFVLGVDWLYWKVEERKLQYANEVHLELKDDVPVAHLKYSKPDFKWTNGFRLAGIYVTPCNTWQVSLAYTYIPTKASHSYVVDPSEKVDFAQTFDNNISVVPNFETSFDIHSKWKSHLSYLDFDIARAFNLCDGFQLCPHLGLRGLWLHQSMKIQALDNLTINSKSKGRLCGGGIEGGLWGFVNLNCGFSLAAHLGGSLVYTKNRNPADNLFIDLDNKSRSLPVSIKDTSYSSIPSVDSFIGFVYTDTLCDMLVSAHVGWEHHAFLGTNQMSCDNEGTLYMQGLTLGASVGF
jgi:hypothetical protein